MRPFPSSLTRRVVITVILAFGGAFLVLAGLIAYLALNPRSGELPRQFARVSATLAAELDRTRDPEQARAIGRTLDALQRLNESRSRISWTFLLDAQGALVYSPPDAPALDFGRLPDGPSTISAHGTRYMVHAHGGAHWRVVIVDNQPDRLSDFIAGAAPALAAYVAIALLLVLAPVWLAVRAGIRPLRALSDQVAQRQATDFGPFDLPRPYQELLPLVTGLNNLMGRLQRSIQRETRFVHDAAHELRTPMAVISTQVHLLLNAESREERNTAQEQLLMAVRRASHLTDQLLKLAQLGGLENRAPEPVDIMDIVRDCAADSVSLCRGRPGALEVQGPDSLEVPTHPHTLRSILDNLLDNAFRYGGQTVSVVLAVSSDPAHWHLVVSDDGPGIPAEERERVFERFHRGAHTHQPGSGLGLAIVRDACQALSGTLRLSAGPDGRGCRFELSFPRHPIREADR